MEKTMTLRLTTLLAMLAVIMSSFAIFPQASEAAFDKNKPTEVNELLNYINNFRTKKGLQKVKVNTTLSNISLDWSSYMADTGTFKHNSEYANKAPAGWNNAGEIIAMNGYGDVEFLFNQWVDSKPHNEIMSNKIYNVVGIGLAYDKNGSLYGTVNFYNYPKTIAGTYDKFPSGTTAPTKPKQTFTDVPSNLIFHREIEQLAQKGITNGWTMKDGTKQYRPFDDVKRDAMIVFIYRAMGSPAYTPPKKSPFTDVSTKHVFYKEIAWAYENGIAEGWKMKDGTRQFRPFEPVKRDAMAAFLMRAAGEKAPVSKTAPFSDVPKSTIFVNEIAWMKETGISTGWTHNNTYQPYSDTKRDAMAAFMIRWMDYTGYQGK